MQLFYYCEDRMYLRCVAFEFEKKSCPKIHEIRSTDTAEGNLCKFIKMQPLLSCIKQLLPNWAQDQHEKIILFQS